MDKQANKPGQMNIDQMFIDQLSAEAVEYIHEDARKEVLDAITNTDNTAEAIAATTYKVTKGLLEKHKPVGLSLEADMGHALALGSEVTDMLVEIVEATQPKAVIDFDSLREESLLRATVMHGEDVEKIGDPEAKEEAQVMYANMIADGTVDQGMAYVNERSKTLGLNTNDMMRKGTEAGTKWAQDYAAAKDPLAEGIKKGMHNMSTPTQPAPQAATEAAIAAPQPEPQPEPQLAAAPPQPQPAAPAPEPAAGPPQPLMGGVA